MIDFEDSLDSADDSDTDPLAGLAQAWPPAALPQNDGAAQPLNDGAAQPLNDGASTLPPAGADPAASPPILPDGQPKSTPEPTPDFPQAWPDPETWSGRGPDAPWQHTMPTPFFPRAGDQPPLDTPLPDTPMPGSAEPDPYFSDPVDRRLHYAGALLDYADQHQQATGSPPAGQDLAAFASRARAEAMGTGWAGDPVVTGKPVRLAMADTGTMTDATTGGGSGGTASSPDKAGTIPAGAIAGASAAARAGAADLAGGAAAAGEGLLGALSRFSPILGVLSLGGDTSTSDKGDPAPADPASGGDAHPTTIADPLAGKPVVLPGTDPSRSHVQAGTPPSEPQQPPPPVPPSQAQPPLDSGIRSNPARDPQGPTIMTAKPSDIAADPTTPPAVDPRLWSKDQAEAGQKGFADWWANGGADRHAQRLANPGSDRVAPSESYIWKNLQPWKNGLKTNGDGLIFGYDRGGGGAHQAEIELWDEKTKKHLGTINPLTGQQIRGPQIKKNGDKRLGFDAESAPDFA